jgi:hypothetical protein
LLPICHPYGVQGVSWIVDAFMISLRWGLGILDGLGNLSAAEKAAYRILACGKGFDDFSFILL